MKANKGKKTWLWILIIVLAVAALGAGGYILYTGLQPKDEYSRYQFDTSAMEGRIQTMTEEEIQAEMDRVVEDGMFNISIASSIIFDAETKEGIARIENIAANHYLMQVDIYLNDTQERVYSGKLIKPGFSIEKITLDKELDPGVYEATAIFNAVTEEELQLFGTAGAEIRLYIPDAEGRFPTATPAPSPTPAM